MIPPAGPESLWPSQEQINDMATLQAYALELEAFINAEPVLDAEHRRALANQAVGMLDTLAIPLYVGQQVVCEGVWSKPVFDETGSIIGEQTETGILEGVSVGFNLQIEEFPADEELGTVSFYRIELAHAVVVGTRDSFHKYGKKYEEYWAFAPIASTRLSTKEEYQQRQVADCLIKFPPDDALILSINHILEINNGLDLEALNALFLQAYDQPNFDVTDYLSYLNALTALSGREFVLQSDQAYLETGAGNYSLHKVRESVVEGRFKEFCFAADVSSTEEETERIILPTGLCISLEISTGDDLIVLVVPTEYIEAYTMQE